VVCTILDTRKQKAGEKLSSLDSRNNYCGKHGKLAVIPDTFVSGIVSLATPERKIALTGRKETR